MFLKRMKLAQKFTVLLFSIFLIGVVASGVVLSMLLNYNAQTTIASKALMLIETMNSVRDYTDTQINPELVNRLDEEFLPQTVPAYSAREVFEQLRRNPDYDAFFYKEAVINPTNPRDKADAFETQIIQDFRRTESNQEVRGFRSVPSGEVFYIARPLSMTNESCLECHGVPADAPATMVALYGDQNGFGWKLNEVIGTQIVSVPASQVRRHARQSFVLIMGIVTVAFATATLLVNLWLKRFVIRPIKTMAMTAEAVSTGDMDAEFHVSELNAKDEVGSLAEAFQRMKMSLSMAMSRLERYRIGRRRDGASS